MNQVEQSIVDHSLHSSRKSVLRVFIYILLLIGVVLAGVISVLYNLEREDFLSRTQLQEQHVVDVVKRGATGKVSTIISDITFLADQNELHSFFETTHSIDQHNCAREYAAFIDARGIYDQVRYIDLDGNEVVRVNSVAGQAVIVPDGQLQNKRNRYYFNETHSLASGQAFISPFDLNVEQGVIESPLKPMIRFGTPVFDKDGVKRGVVILNYLGQNLLDELISADLLISGKMLLINANGYWLRGLSADDEWGFMYDKDHQPKFSDDFPEEWQVLASEGSGQFVSQHGLFTFSTIYPLGDEAHSQHSPEHGIGHAASCSDFWILVAYVPEDVLFSQSKILLVRLTILAVLLLLLSAVPSWWIAQVISQRRLKQLELVRMANYDKLTNLPNRSLLDDRLGQLFHQSKRHGNQFAVLFADLDGFKAVNDTLGHDVGDLLLIGVAERMVKLCRRADTVARVGGDEFVIVLTKIEQKKDAEFVANKISGELRRPFEINGRQVQIDVSVGISCYPTHGETLAELLKYSDQEMYRVKNQKKAAR